MSTIYDDSVFQIQSQDKNNSKFGTGFVFYVDEKLDELVQKAYGLFSKYKLGKSLSVCSCCVSSFV